MYSDPNADRRGTLFRRGRRHATGYSLAWGNGINRAWGLALRKRFCVNFDRELQAAATDDGIVISLVEQHSFPTADVFSMLRPAIVERELTQAVLASPFFTNRWRWNAARAGGGAPQRRKKSRSLYSGCAPDLLGAVFRNR